MPLTIESFKRFFQKKLASSKSNYEYRKGKVIKALTELEVVVEKLWTDDKDEAAGHFEKEAVKVRKQLKNTDEVAKTNPKAAFKSLEAIKEGVRGLVVQAKNPEKYMPLSVRVSTDTKATIYPSDIPGYGEMDEDAREEMVKKVGGKVKAGKDLLHRVLEKGDQNVAPTRKDVTDMMWYLKSKAEETDEEAYERGAMTIPDPDGKIREFLDKSTEVYMRDSSHMEDQQKKVGGQARGIDFYEGVEEGEVKDPDSLLPSGMRTVLYQQVVTKKGEKRLYLKMETESARWNPFFSAREGEDSPENRPLRTGDKKNAVLHLGNLVKSKLGMSQGEDTALRGKREKLDPGVAKAYEAAMKSAEKHKKEYPDVAELLAKGKGSIHAILEAIASLDQTESPLDDNTAQHLGECLKLMLTVYKIEDIESRVGSEVVVGEEALESPALPVSEAIGLLGEAQQAVEGCQHTDDVKDLRKVLNGALAAIKQAADHKENIVVQSHVKALKEKLPPLIRLIQRMEKK